MPNFVTQPAFDEYVGDQQGAGNVANRASALLAAERAVSEYIGRTPSVAGDTATARLYVPSGDSILRIHDCTEVTSIAVSGTTLTASTYQLEPYAVSWTGLATPYEQVRLLLDYWRIITPGEATVTVTAKWGWSAVPAEVVEATKIIGKDILAQRHTVGNIAAVGDFGGTVRINTYVRQLLAPLRRVEAFGIA